MTLRQYQVTIKKGDKIKLTLSPSKFIIGIVEGLNNRRSSFFILDDSGYRHEVAFNNDSSIFIEILGGLEVKKQTKRVKAVRDLYITLEKTKQGIAINLKVPQEVEDYYSNISKNEKEKSESWFSLKKEGAEFYLLTDKLKQMERDIDNDTFTNFGDGLLEGERINTAILRTVGASKGVKITSENFSKVNNIELEFYSKRLGEFVKKLWEAYIAETTIKAHITFEI